MTLCRAVKSQRSGSLNGLAEDGYEILISGKPAGIDRVQAGRVDRRRDHTPEP
jgi:hypothetical protein